ncbi:MULTISPECIES: caspase family protein [unclassified Microcoleus]|uniref:caspase family protein n=1 Tax=unclassified Microcoleus TaxID=2642155 RepID=UPI0025EB88AF|nr:MULTISPECIES: caspase family protein [unclassified Microcoleus]
MTRKRKALVVGINRYPFLKDAKTGKVKHLTTPASDAEEIAKLLEADNNFIVHRLPFSEIDSKIQVDPKKSVNADDLKREIRWLFQNEEEPDTVLLFFAGHSFPKQNSLGTKQQIWLETSDSKFEDKKGVLLNDVWDSLEDCKVKEQIIWLDSCYSGELLEFKESDFSGRNRKRFLIAASHSSEVAYQRLDENHGVLSGALIEGLSVCTPTEDEWITERTLAVEVERHLTAYYKQTKLPQTPLIRNSDRGQPIQIKRGKIKLEAKEKEITNIQFRMLFHEILNADFKAQVTVVREVIQKHKTAAFLIHGEQYCGQQLLVTRLSRLNPKWKNISPIKVDVGQRAVGGRIPYLWKQLTSWLSLPQDAESDRIIERVCDRLVTQDVIFIFDRVNDMQSRVLSGWIQEFWEPLVVRVEKHCSSKQRNTHLLMFLVDNNGSVCKSDLLLTQKIDELSYSKSPLSLPPISPFTVDLLNELIDRVTTIENLNFPVDFNSEILFENSENGIPEFVYEELCCHCGYSWEGGLAKWLI